MKRLIPIAIMGSLLSGCVIERTREGKREMFASLAKLKIGTSTKADVLKELGTPSLDEIKPEEEILSYRYVSDSSVGFSPVLDLSSSERYTITVVLDQAGRIKTITRK